MASKREPKDRYFVYQHESGTTHFKRFLSARDVKEMVDSTLVKAVIEVTREQWLNYNRTMTEEEKAAFTLSDHSDDPRTLPGGIIGRLK